MHLVVTGLNHKTAPVDLREILAFDGEETARALAALNRYGAAEAALLSTCNRTEVYTVAADPEVARAAGLGLLAERAGAADREELSRALYTRQGVEAARHLFRVAAGLDSLALGEAQIIGQVREARRRAERCDALGPVLFQLFNQALRAGKRVRAETGIGEGAVSISYAAVELAKKIFDDLGQRTILLVGAGKMAELAAKNLADQGGPAVLVANRTREHAVRLAARVGGSAIPLERVESLLASVDIVIASTGAKSPIITYKAVQAAMKRRRGNPLFIIDIAVPRDVEPSVHTCDGVFLYNIDDLEAVVEANLAERRRILPAAERIVAWEAESFGTWLAERAAVPAIVALRRKVTATIDAEVERLLRRLDHLPEREREEIRAAARRISGKLLHEPTLKLKAASEAGRGPELYTALVDLFDLDGLPLPAEEGGACAGRDSRAERSPQGVRLRPAGEGSLG